MKHWSEKLKDLNACNDAIEWAATQESPSVAWQNCPRGDWMLWLLTNTMKTKAQHRRMVLAACECARLSWISRDLLAEVLRRAAKDNIKKLKIAGLILIKRDWCWKKFLALNDPLKSWALSELAKWVKDDTSDEIKEILSPYRLHRKKRKNKVDRDGKKI